MLESGSDWSEADASRALDLMGVAIPDRSGRTPVDAPEGSEPVAFRLALAGGQLEGLEDLRDESLIPLDEADRRRVLAGDSSLSGRAAALTSGTSARPGDATASR